MSISAITSLWASVIFQVGILTTAGNIGDIQTTGSDAPCIAVSISRISCPSTTPVTFSWEGDDNFELVGETTVYPGYEGHAWVLATDANTTAWDAQLNDPELTADTVRALFVRTGANTPPSPSLSMVKQISKLASHTDPTIRMAAADAAHPWFAGTRLDPMPIESPPLLKEKLLVQLSTDPHKGVRRRVLHMLRDLRAPYSRAAAQSILLRLSRDNEPSIRRAAAATLKRGHQVDIVSPEEAWESALKMLAQPGPPGRSASNTLAHLARWVEPNADIRPLGAIRLALKFHPERVWRLWTAWRKHVPLNENDGLTLFRETVGLSEPLVKHWAKHQPELLHRILQEWEPTYPHSQRWDQLSIWFYRIKDRDLRTLIGLPPEAPVKQKKKIKIKINLKDVSRGQPVDN